MKNLIDKKRTSGFTIIEVMIVLAIAGLIMVIVFIAVPQLQRNQRDNARQNVANRVEAEMETFAGNNEGKYPVDNGALLLNFVGNYYNKLQKQNPKTGTDYTIGYATGYGQAPTENQLLLYRDGKCQGESAVQGPTGAGTGIGNTNTRSIALRVQLDNASSYYCVDNS